MPWMDAPLGVIMALMSNTTIYHLCCYCLAPSLYHFTLEQWTSQRGRLRMKSKNIDVSLGWTCWVLHLLSMKMIPQNDSNPRASWQFIAGQLWEIPLPSTKSILFSVDKTLIYIYYGVIWISYLSILCALDSCGFARFPIHCVVSCITASGQWTILQITRNMRVYSFPDLKNTELGVFDFQTNYQYIFPALRMPRQENHGLEITLGYVKRPYQKKKVAATLWYSERHWNLETRNIKLHETSLTDFSNFLWLANSKVPWVWVAFPVHQIKNKLLCGLCQ